jgi:hypothetical protein
VARYNQPRRTWRYTEEFKAKAVQLSLLEGVLVARLKQLDGRKRHRRKASFINWLKSQCQGLVNGANPEAVCKELVSAALIRESGSDIAYEIER